MAGIRKIPASAGHSAAFAAYLFACACACAGAAPALAATSWSTAEFVLSGDPVPPAPSARWERQPLPDDWRKSRPDAATAGWYRFLLPISSAPDEPHALYIPLVGVEAAVFVNGERIGDTGPPAESARRTWKQPQLFTIPPALLRAGDNVVHVRVRGDIDRRGSNEAWSWSGLGGPVAFGTDDELRPRYRNRVAWQVVTPIALAGAIGLTGLFFIVLWAQRRGETIYGLFGAAALLWAARTLSDLTLHRIVPPPHWEIWLTVAYALYATMLCKFALRFAGASWPRTEGFFVAFVAASPVALYVAAWAQAGAVAGRAVLLVVLVLVAAVAFAVVRAAWWQRSLGITLMALTGVVSFVFALHDWIAVTRAEWFDNVRLVPYSAILFISIAGWLLLQRFAQSTEALERLNVELDRRVAEKSAALQSNLEALARAKAEAEAANQAKSRFLAAASHDLRQPLHAIGLFGAALDLRAKAPDLRGLVAKLNASIAALDDLVNELLDVSKLDAGADRPEPRDVPVQALLDRLALDFGPLAAEKGIRLRVRPSRETAHTDPALLERLLRNLVSNAVRYTERGGVLVACRRRGDALALEVWDTGVGIAPADRERIFEEFYQVGNAERDRSKGSGLGLAIVRRIAALLGARVALRSTPGRGSVFSVRVARGGPGALRAVAARGVAPERAARRIVAVVEDDRVVREAMTTLLAERGHRVIAGASLEEVRRALAAAGARPELVIADMRLPGGATGVEAVRALRGAFGPELPALIVTGETARDLVAEAVASGIPLLRKPVSPGRLIEEVDRLAARSESTAPTSA
ncbi:MAG: ATP-binding protein [Burkholderiales bacterium]|nr:ATP-binding protein [Burkholderiales bacterium]